MTIPEIAAKLITHCKSTQWEAAQRELYAENAVSIEPYETPNFPRETKGLPAIIAKGKKFDAMVEKLHSIQVSDPLIATSSFAVTMSMDLDMKGQGNMKMKELCVYEVKDGKIIAERFFV